MNPANTQGVPQAPLSLLQQISEDADLRASLESDPVSFFAGYGIQIQGPLMVSDLSDKSSQDDSMRNWAGLL